MHGSQKIEQSIWPYLAQVDKMKNAHHDSQRENTVAHQQKLISVFVLGESSQRCILDHYWPSSCDRITYYPENSPDKKQCQHYYFDNIHPLEEIAPARLVMHHFCNFFNSHGNDDDQYRVFWKIKNGRVLVYPIDRRYLAKKKFIILLQACWFHENGFIKLAGSYWNNLHQACG